MRRYNLIKVKISSQINMLISDIMFEQFHKYVFSLYNKIAYNIYIYMYVFMLNWQYYRCNKKNENELKIKLKQLK